GVERDRRGQGAALAVFRLGEPSCRAQRDLLQLCRDEGIAIALLWMPETAAYRSWYGPDVLARVRAFLGEIGRDYGAPLIDAREWVGDDGFSDGHHLTTAGAAVFTERFGREALLPALEALGARDLPRKKVAERPPGG